VSATKRSLVHRSPTKRGVSEYDLETPKMRRRKPELAVEPCEINNNNVRPYIVESQFRHLQYYPVIKTCPRE
jgi:hypothetical protein